MEVNGYKIKPGADLRDAVLSFAGLTRANLTGAILEFIDLTGATMPDGSKHD